MVALLASLSHLTPTLKSFLDPKVGKVQCWDHDLFLGLLFPCWMVCSVKVRAEPEPSWLPL